MNKIDNNNDEYKVNLENNTKLSFTDLYNEICTGREFEISFLWQRSIFLGAFMIAVLTMFCAACSKFCDIILKVDIDSITSEINLINIKSLVNLIKSVKSFSLLYGLILIAILGLFFSFLWIFMAKGSKFWSECYEQSTKSIFDDLENLGDKVFEDELLKHLKDSKDTEIQFPYYCNLKSKEDNRNIFSTHGGKFSVSRINILIGQIFGFFWLISIISILSIMLMMTTSILFYIPLCIIVIVCLSFLIINFKKNSPSNNT